MFNKVNGKDVLKGAITADGVSDLGMSISV